MPSPVERFLNKLLRRGPSVGCPCIQAVRTDDRSPLIGLAAVRLGCPARRLLLAPDSVWSVIVANASGAPDKALHCSCLLRAYSQGTLDKMTGPVHRFLLSGQNLHPSLTNQYRQDLQERWLSEPDEISRHDKFRMFFGKVIELQVAEWLTAHGWTITRLAALGDTFDIAALSPEQAAHAVEVKYMGQGNDDFGLVLDALGGGPGVGSLPLYGAINFLLFKVYEAAFALRNHVLPKMVVVVVDAQTWPTIQVPLENRWLDWQAPAFLATEEHDWNQFLNKQRQGRHPAIDAELPGLVMGLNRVVVLLLESGFRYSIVLDERLAG